MKLDARKIDLVRRALGWSKVELNRRIGLPVNDKSLCHALATYSDLNVSPQPYGVAWNRLPEILGGTLEAWSSSPESREAIADLTLEPYDALRAKAILMLCAPNLLDDLHYKV